MKVFLFFATIALIVGGAFWYLNRPVCTGDCQTDHEKYCLSLRTHSGDYEYSYAERVRMTLKGCL